MSLDMHTVAVPSGAAPAYQDRVLIANLPSVPNVVGASAGAAVVTAVTMVDLPSAYSVLVNPGQDATWFVSGKTSTGFNVTLTPRLAANTLAAGTFDVTVVA